MKKYLLIPAGGEGSRISDLTEKKIHKSCLKIQQKTLLQRVLEFWNLKDNFLLLRENYNSVIDEIKNINEFKSKINLSIELEPLGKGGAILNAIKYLNIQDEDIFIIHNSDDLILNIEADKIIQQHIEFDKDISVIGVTKTYSPYTGFTIISNNVESVEQNFLIKKAVHTGVCIIKGRYIKEKRDLNQILNFEFEKEWFQECISTQNLNFIEIEYENWFPINESKQFNRLKQHLEKESL